MTGMARRHSTGGNPRSSVLVLDFGSQVSRLIVRRLRTAGVFSELLACDAKAEDVAAVRPAAVILSGGPSSVYEEGAPHIRRDVWELLQQKKVPILGICYGLQELVFQLGGKVAGGGPREFGKTVITLCPLPPEKLLDDAPAAAAAAAAGAAAAASGQDWCVPAAHAPSPAAGDLFYGIEGPEVEVWMSHGDKVESLPPAFVFHPEVAHTPCGQRLLSNFAQRVARLDLSWGMQSFVPLQIEALKQQINGAPVIGALSGGVDSTVAAALLHKAIGGNFFGFLIDTGLLRKHEAAETLAALRRCFPDLNLECIDAGDRFLLALKGVTDPEQKRKIIGALFIEVFEEAVKAKNLQAKGTFLLQGTLYPDLIESKSYRGPSHTIKTHHNVGGLPERMNLKVLEPLRDLFKDEVRDLGRALGLPEDRVGRHPFPGPGLAAFVVLLPECRSVGVMGDGRTYEATCALRAVESSDFMTADWFRIPLDVLAAASSRITNEVRGINRVVYDITSKPPATIEWE
ncbi:hypothetical protein Emag_002076 [Eimeria magna]